MFSFENNMLQDKCKVKSVQYNLKYKNKAVRVCYIPGITYMEDFFFIFIYLLFSHLLASYV